MYRFFELDPIYAERFSKVWMWNDWPDKGNVGDVGIDLVAQERATGEYVAIQCKFYLPEHTLSKPDIDSFFTAAGRDPFTSGMIVSTTDKWGKNAEDALKQSKPVTRLSVHDLEASPVDWSRFDARRPQDLDLLPKKKLREHQKKALEDVIQGLAAADRGKLIMACGTGKTFTVLKIAEKLAPGGKVLFLVPSLSLLSQALREWTAEAENPPHSFAVCSDVNIGKRRKKTSDDTEDITLHDLAFPATTSAKQLVSQYHALTGKAALGSDDEQLTVVFSTYHSIETVSKAQKSGLPEFDLIICDEAHRTTGVTLVGEDESHFVKVHDANFIKARKRLYMTATPRIYGDQAKSKAREATAELASMDDPELFGHELHRLGFGEAVKHGLLTDYKVLVLAVDESYVAKTFQKQLAKDGELNLDDATRITGCWNGLEKRFEAIKDAPDLQGDVQPMRRAVAFSRTIKDSKKFRDQFRQIVQAYKDDHPDLDVLEVETDHVDGSYDALRRNELLRWLKDDAPGNTARVLSNARCLSEGVDVPALDAVMFLNPRNSVIDVVQSVGRVMRLSPDKRFGYIILPIGIPADKTPEEALKDNEKYKVVWQVLQALRAHDDRFNATINQIELNKNRPDNIQVIGAGPIGKQRDDESTGSDGDSTPKAREIQGVFAFPQLDAIKDAIYAKMVMKVGDRAYWETWAKDIAAIAEQHITRIKALVKDKDAPYAKDFAEFLAGLQQNLNPAVTSDEAVEMLAQHLITKPVFDALFAHYAFTDHNPVSQSMQRMLDLLHEQAIEKEAVTLEKFYESVRDRAKDLDNAEARQKVVIELYEEFFKNAFPRMAERLGIVYTPTEVVDFIIHSVQDILRDEFNSSLGEKDVHIIDPFTGTGTFIVRLLQSGFIPPHALAHKYKHELHANEIVLLAYYIAAINIEETYHGLAPAHGTKAGSEAEYVPFEGIVLTDTFQLYESKGELADYTFPENNKRVKRQKESPIRVVICNPPYSANQGDANANNQNLKYAALDTRIGVTYAARSTATNKNSIYDSYVRAIRWASDRINGKGVIGFVTNGYFIDGNAMDGVRACLTDEFQTVHVFNLRGNARTSGELRKMEAGNVFGGGGRIPIAITLLVKNPTKKSPATIRYHDIGDYLSRDEKLAIVKGFSSVSGIEKAKKWTTLTPNDDHDWINQRDPGFEKFVPIGDKEDAASSIFAQYSGGLKTNRDTWCYAFSQAALAANMSRMLKFYAQQVEDFRRVAETTAAKDRLNAAQEFINTDSTKIQWSRGLVADLSRFTERKFNKSVIRLGHYRPFCKQWAYFDRYLNDMVYRLPMLFPNPGAKNIAICTTAAGNRESFSVLISDLIPDVHMSDKSGASQCFPLYLYEKADESSGLQFDTSEIIDGYRRRDAITDARLKAFRAAYGQDSEGVSKDDIFYYVYGILHSPEYRERFAADLRKMLPRIPLTKETKDFWAFSKAGRDLAEWHLNYESVEPWPVVEHIDRLTLDPEELFKVKKMTFARPNTEQKKAGEKWDKTQIIYNSHVTITHIPLEAYDYVVNGKPAIEWIMERYEVKRDPASGIVNDPNDWCNEHNNPRYIVDLIARIVRVSMETMAIVRNLPNLNERKD
ncbi:MAG: DEAD/DEAH box helicase [Phycisphaeraceae bacterium]|nr:DEAD/DEAH box helicase [Phycisphaeraceae bacterium]